MPTRLLLDGEDLPSLMLRVRSEMGPGARIVKAERIRTGGFAGFFAKEHYELTVEVPEPVRPGRRRLAPRGTAPGDAAGIDALLAAADAAEQEDADLIAGRVAGGGAPEGAGAPAAAEPTGASGGAGTPEGPDEPEAPEEPPAPVMSTSGETFAQILESVRQMVGPVPQRATLPAQAADDAAAPDADAPDDEADEADDDAPDADEAQAGEPQPDEGAAGAVEPAPAAPPAPAPTPARAAEPDDRGSGSTISTFLELGLPTRVLQGFGDPGAPVPLSQLVRRFDRAPALRVAPGQVLAVAGDPATVLRTATQMAGRVGVAPEDIVLAGAMEPVAGHGRRLQTVPALARYRARVSADVPAVVALGVGPERDDWDEAAMLLEALHPDQAWAVVDARRKAADLRRWLRGVGSRRAFDAVAATATFDAQAPGTVLNLGTPVGWVDGLPASPVVWAAVLSERLADDARWD
ncbi:hypothetical protein [Actinotalea subterranea]|uniref:hypothetical protein n=1 Tax=Actinotalea subterranea TaxID=2607497 RepID=UPI0011EBA9BC|nr:hypothetical protein [Actinotalea subterranea]